MRHALQKFLHTPRPGYLSLFLAIPLAFTFYFQPTEATTGPRVIRSYVTHASWYGPGFFGRTMANGRTYTPEVSATVVAERRLPFGTRLRVTNLYNDASHVLIVQDRGPYRRDRHDVTLDVGAVAADRLGMKQHGIVPVRVEVLD